MLLTGYTVETLKAGALFESGQYEAVSHRMGQYMFVNVPEISLLAWHPFTISSAPSDGITT